MSEQRLPPEVIKQLGYYVYRLIDPRHGETFYVGKGKGNRLFAHVRGALSITDPQDEDADDAKLSRIVDIQRAGLEVGHIIHRHGMDEQTALQVESALMDAYPGLTNRVGGHGSEDFGVAHVSQLIRLYSAEEFVPRHRLLALSVGQSYFERGSIYEAVRYAWRLDPQKTKGRLVLAVEQGLVIDVYRPERWLPATPENFPSIPPGTYTGRWGFEGVEAEEDVAREYMHTRLPATLRNRSSQNPVKYIEPVLEEAMA